MNTFPKLLAFNFKYIHYIKPQTELWFLIFVTGYKVEHLEIIFSFPWGFVYIGQTYMIKWKIV